MRRELTKSDLQSLLKTLGNLEGYRIVEVGQGIFVGLLVSHKSKTVLIRRG